jgi:hypothetical protein
MTKITTDKVLKRETGCTDRLRPIVVEIHRFYCRVRVKGTREFYDIAWDHILDRGRMKLALDAQAAAGRKRA